MKKVIKNKKVTTDDLAIMVARGFEGVGKDIKELKKDVGELKKNVGELKEGNKNIRKDILNLGDRFPSQFAFNELSSRVYTLEKIVKEKIK